MKLNVMSIVNGNYQEKERTEWDNNTQGAVIAFLNRCAVLEAEVTVTDAEVKILDEQLNTFEGNARHISHAVAEGYLHDSKFYANYNEETGKYTDEIAGRNDTLYIDLTEGQNRKKYKWNGSAFVAI